MTPVRALALTVLFAALTLSGSAAASAEPLPPYDGVMTFPPIADPSGPEQFSWEVQLHEGQELRAVDDRQAAVYYTDSEHLAFEIDAVAARDVVGTDVPTTLAVTPPNVITLTVHHRAGDPAAGGAPFDYPVVAGAGWEGGIVTVIDRIPPPTVQPPAPTEVFASPLSGMVATCLVPDLTGRSLKASRKILRRSRCQLGRVRGERGRGARVVKQYREPGRYLPADSRVGVKLG